MGRLAMKVARTLMPFPLVYVEWVDHASYTGWADIKELQEASALTQCYTVAYLIKDNPDEIIVTTTVSEHGQATDPLTISRRLILSLEYVNIRKMKAKVVNGSQGKESADSDVKTSSGSI